MTRRTYNISVEPKGDAYHNMIDYGLSQCEYFLLVVRETMDFDLRAREVIHRLSPFTHRVDRTSEWPGTRLLGGYATVYQYHFLSESAAILKRSTQSLYAWLAPSLPEDLCLLRADGSAWLVSIAHEQDGYLELSDDEFSVIAKALPRFSAKLQKDEGI